ncbi:hypothetical protein TNCV_4907931 [Trichonephila clavipes]|uniref:Uncharacterized protein n=1 Tax=Trichonephila clavipes TaxID=2585209 RepID=A0A8X6RST1_TRICX|nr:hypothetical protein TNCV_4907931 [Trichonephila clavipes]
MPSSSLDILTILLILSPTILGSFAMREKGDNCLVPGPDYMLDALKLPNQAPRGFGESLQRPGVVLMEHNASSVGRFWPFLFNL